MGEEPTRIPGEQSEEGELLGREVDVPLAHRDAVPGEVHDDIPHRKDRLLEERRSGPVTQSRPDPRQQLRSRGRLRDIVVGSGAVPAQPSPPSLARFLRSPACD